jgi:hypothetical protein
MRYIILVSGFSKSGKDLLSDYLILKKPNFVKLKIASDLKKTTAVKYDFDYKLTLTQDGKCSIVENAGRTVRDLLINEAFVQKQEFGNNVFVANTVNEINKLDFISNVKKTGLKHIVISDFRFKNEFDYITNYIKSANIADTNIITVRVNRFENSPVNSDTETQLNEFNFDYTIDNTQSIPMFYTKIDKIISDIF